MNSTDRLIFNKFNLPVNASKLNFGYKALLVA